LNESGGGGVKQGKKERRTMARARSREALKKVKAAAARYLMPAVWVYYKGEWPHEVERLVRPGVPFGGGTDLRTGESDVSYEFKTARGARGAAARIKKALGRRVRVRLVDCG
jgi:hypothetical protein